MSPASLDTVVLRFIQDAGTLSQSLGFGRAIGQIYAYLYFSQEARSLTDMQHRLGISKGSASTNVRQLEQWGAVKKVWVKGDRKDYYEANDWFGRILKNALVDTVNKRVSAYGASLEESAQLLNAQGRGNGEAAFIRDRIQHIQTFYRRAESLVKSPLWKAFLGGE